MKRLNIIILLAIISLVSINGNKVTGQEKPHIVNIINFIRLLEPRGVKLTQDVLYQTVVNQIAEMKKHNLGGTFLLQYDALMDGRYQKLFKELPKEFEIGAWFEIPQPLAEKAGFKWRGRYPWDWHANVGFSIGYKPDERKKLVDVYFTDFKKIYGYYPKSVGCWFIDEVTLNYMYEKYGITASCNCRDQVGTDGYTLWGGYWNQAYYPSKNNSYMPAQDPKNQISVPIFRMLGSDPIRQADATSMEPANINDGGNDSAYVDWYFNEFLNGPCMEFAYVQLGQENSFGWNRLGKGFTYQMNVLAELRDKNKIKVETLSETGHWFKQNYKTTPASSVTILNGKNNDNRKTIWFNSRYYRANLLWEDGNLRFRDVHLFDEKLKSKYYKEVNTQTSCEYYTLPFIDSYLWGKATKSAGLHLKAIVDGNEVLVEGGNIAVDESKKGKLNVSWQLKNIDGIFKIDFDERGVKMYLESEKTVGWFFDLQTPEDSRLPFTKIKKNKIECSENGTNYSVNIKQGFILTLNQNAVFRMLPQNGKIVLDFPAK